MTNSLHSLLSNLAIVAIVVSIWARLDDPGDRLRAMFRTLWLAFLLGGSTVAIMLLPFEVHPGVFADLRVAMILLSGFFGGPLLGAASLLAGICYRLWVGGLGAPSAIVTMIAALAIALVGRQALAGRIAGRREVFVLAVLAAVDSVAGVLLLPASIRGSLSPDVLAVIATLTFVAIAGAGRIIAGNERRREVVRQNVIYRAIIDALPEPLHVKDLAGHFIAANPATAALIRVNKVEDLIGRDDFEFFPAETASRFDTTMTG